MEDPSLYPSVPDHNYFYTLVELIEPFPSQIDSTDKSKTLMKGCIFPLELFEKNWITYQMVHILLDLDNAKRIHGNIAPTNIFFNDCLKVSLGPNIKPRSYEDVFSFLEQYPSTHHCYVNPTFSTPTSNQPSNSNPDFFSVGCILYYLWTGEHLFKYGDSTNDRVAKINAATIKLPDLKDLILNLTKSSPTTDILKDFLAKYSSFQTLYDLIYPHDNLTPYQIFQQIKGMKGYECISYRFIAESLFCEVDPRSYPELVNQFYQFVNDWSGNPKSLSKPRIRDQFIPTLLELVCMPSSYIATSVYPVYYRIIPYHHMLELIKICPDFEQRHMEYVLTRLANSESQESFVTTFIDLLPEFFATFAAKFKWMHKVAFPRACLLAKICTIDPLMFLMNCVTHKSYALYVFVKDLLNAVIAANKKKASTDVFDAVYDVVEACTDPLDTKMVAGILNRLSVPKYFMAVMKMPETPLILIEAFAKATAIEKQSSVSNELIAARMYISQCSPRLKQMFINAVGGPDSLQPIPSLPFNTTPRLHPDSRYSFTTRKTDDTLCLRPYKTTFHKAHRVSNSRIDAVLAFKTPDSALHCAVASGGAFYYSKNMQPFDKSDSVKYNVLSGYTANDPTTSTSITHTNIGSTVIDTRAVFVVDNQVVTFDGNSWTAQRHPYIFPHLSYHTTNQFVCTGKTLSTIKVFDITQSKVVAQWESSTTPITSISSANVSPSIRSSNVFMYTVMSSANEGSVIACDMRCKCPISKIPHIPNLQSVYLTDTNLKFVVVCKDKTFIYDEYTPQEIFCNPSFVANYQNTAFMFDPFGLYAVSMGDHLNSYRIDHPQAVKWNPLVPGRRGNPLHGHRHRITHASICDLLVVSGDECGNVHFYDHQNK